MKSVPQENKNKNNKKKKMFYKIIIKVLLKVTLILTWIIDSPISPESWLLSLLFVIVVTMVKQGYEDYLRSVYYLW